MCRLVGVHLALMSKTERSSSNRDTREKERGRSPWDIGSRGWTRWCRCSPATPCSAMATVGGAQWRLVAAEHPVAHSSSWSEGGEVGRGGTDSQGIVSRGPHLPYMVLRDGACNPSGWAPPIRKLSQGPSWPTLWANWWRSTLTKGIFQIENHYLISVPEKHYPQIRVPAKIEFGLPTLAEIYNQSIHSNTLNFA
jgi:hypothetical protein